ncbi:hypothetical protein NECID01_0283 [Nematocida sp. AWRm77]|nr:hypothetical protein NECID01_0283 [Nematocida sp. AWRm77]
MNEQQISMNKETIKHSHITMKRNIKAVLEHLKPRIMEGIREVFDRNIKSPVIQIVNEDDAEESVQDEVARETILTYKEDMYNSFLDTVWEEHISEQMVKEEDKNHIMQILARKHIDRNSCLEALDMLMRKDAKGLKVCIDEEVKNSISSFNSFIEEIDEIYPKTITETEKEKEKENFERCIKKMADKLLERIDALHRKEIDSEQAEQEEKAIKDILWNTSKFNNADVKSSFTIMPLACIQEMEKETPNLFQGILDARSDQNTLKDISVSESLALFWQNLVAEKKLDEFICQFSLKAHRFYKDGDFKTQLRFESLKKKVQECYEEYVNSSKAVYDWSRYTTDPVAMSALQNSLKHLDAVFTDMLEKKAFFAEHNLLEGSRKKVFEETASTYIQNVSNQLLKILSVVTNNPEDTQEDDKDFLWDEMNIELDLLNKEITSFYDVLDHLKKSADKLHQKPDFDWSTKPCTDQLKESIQKLYMPEIRARSWEYPKDQTVEIESSPMASMQTTMPLGYMEDERVMYTIHEQPIEDEDMMVEDDDSADTVIHVPTATPEDSNLSTPVLSRESSILTEARVILGESVRLGNSSAALSDDSQLSALEQTQVETEAEEPHTVDQSSPEKKVQQEEALQVDASNASVIDAKEPESILLKTPEASQSPLEGSIPSGTETGRAGYYRPATSSVHKAASLEDLLAEELLRDESPDRTLPRAGTPFESRVRSESPVEEPSRATSPVEEPPRTRSPDRLLRSESPVEESASEEPSRATLPGEKVPSEKVFTRNSNFFSKMISQEEIKKRAPTEELNTTGVSSEQPSTIEVPTGEGAPAEVSVDVSVVAKDAAEGIDVMVEESTVAPTAEDVVTAEIEVPTAPAADDVVTAEIEVPTAPTAEDVATAEIEVPTAPTVEDVVTAEVEVPTAEPTVPAAPVTTVVEEVVIVAPTAEPTVEPVTPVTPVTPVELVTPVEPVTPIVVPAAEDEVPVTPAAEVSVDISVVANGPAEDLDVVVEEPNVEDAVTLEVEQPTVEPVEPVTPVEPVVAPVEPVVAPVEPVVAPVEPVTPAVAPVTSAVAPVTSAAEPTAPVTPAAEDEVSDTPVTPVVEPVTPVTPVVAPVTSAAAPVTPTAPVTPVAANEGVYARAISLLKSQLIRDASFILTVCMGLGMCIYFLADRILLNSRKYQDLWENIFDGSTQMSFVGTEEFYVSLGLLFLGAFLLGILNGMVSAWMEKTKTESILISIAIWALYITILAGACFVASPYNIVSGGIWHNQLVSFGPLTLSLGPLCAALISIIALPGVAGIVYLLNIIVDKIFSFLSKVYRSILKLISLILIITLSILYCQMWYLESEEAASHQKDRLRERACINNPAICYGMERYA